MKKVNLLSISVSTGGYSEFVENILQSALARKSDYACVANVHMLVEARRNTSFASVVSNADFITPDGKPLAWALRVLHGIRQDRVAGMDLLPDLLQNAMLQRIPVYFYGGSEKMLNETRRFLADYFPDLIIAGSYSPPFRQLSETEEEAVVRQINNSGAALVFVVLGCPKQEKWMAAMKGRVKADPHGDGFHPPFHCSHPFFLSWDAPNRKNGWLQ